MTRTFRILLVVFVLIAVTAAVSEAQILDRPARPFRGLFGGAEVPNPNRTRQELTVFADILGGYDNNLAPEGASPLQRSITPTSGYTGLGDIAMRYWHGTAARNFEAEGRGFVTAYRLTGIEPLVGSSLHLRGQTAFDRRTRLEVNGYLSRDPFLGFGGFDGMPDTAGAAALANPANGLTTGLSWSRTAIGALTREWTRRTRTTLSYDYTKREYLRGPGFDGDSQAAEGGFEHNVTQTLSWRANYRYYTAEFVEPSGRRPIKNDSIDGGFSYSRNLSRTRRIAFGATGGATRVRTVSAATSLPLEYWTPSGTGTVRIDLYRSWALDADYRRGLSVIDGITTESFIADAVLLRAGGHVTSRIDLMFATGYSNGRTGDALTQGTYRTYTGTAQFRAAVARWAAAVVNYNYFNYDLDAITVSSVTGIGLVPTSFDRQAIRFGLTLWLPLIGGYVERPTDRIGDL